MAKIGCCAGQNHYAHQGCVPTDVLLGPSEVDSLPTTQDHSDALFDSVILRPKGPIDARMLAKELVDENLGIVRAKGFVADTSGKMVLIQIVGRRWDVTNTSPDAQTAVVCIGFSGHLNKSALSRLSGQAAHSTV